MSTDTKLISIVIPAKNEAGSLQILLPTLKEAYKEAEIIVVNDGSTDATLDVCRQEEVKVVTHPHSKGNGAAIKSGARAANGEILVFMDADGQHKSQHLPPLLDKLGDGYDMVVGSRGKSAQANGWRWAANALFSKLASWMVGERIPDLTSGLRAIDAFKFKQFLYLLPNGFSYPTTITMAFFRAGYSVGYVDTPVDNRSSNERSHIRPLSDGMKFLLIIMRIATLYSPLKIFVPISSFFFLFGTGYVSYTLIVFSRFTNFGGLLFITSMLVFLIGLVSEQITSLHYSQTDTQ